MRVQMPRYTRIFLFKKGNISYYIDEHPKRFTPWLRYVYERMRHQLTLQDWYDTPAQFSEWITRQILPRNNS